MEYCCIKFYITAINIRSWPIKSFYQFDGIKYVSFNGANYVIGAAEGDVRELTVEDHGLSEDFEEAARGGSSTFLGLNDDSTINLHETNLFNSCLCLVYF